MHPTSTAVKALARFTTCDIGDALVKLGLRTGGFLSGLRGYSPAQPSTAKVFGPAYTIKMVSATDKESPSPAKHFADTIPKGSVVFVSQPKGLVSACWGGLMSTRAKALGAAGVVIDGRFRDINEHRELGMGLFARDVSILGSNTFTRSSELNVPITYHVDGLQGTDAQIMVNPGDLIMGDSDGVVCIPPQLVEMCLEICSKRYDIDEETRACLEKGEEMGPTLKRLRK